MPRRGIDALPALWLADRDEGWDHPTRWPALPLQSMRAALHPSVELSLLRLPFPEAPLSSSKRNGIRGGSCPTLLVNREPTKDLVGDCASEDAEGLCLRVARTQAPLDIVPT